MYTLGVWLRCSTLSEDRLYLRVAPYRLSSVSMRILVSRSGVQDADQSLSEVLLSEIAIRGRGSMALIYVKMLGRGNECLENERPLPGEEPERGPGFGLDGTGPRAFIGSYGLVRTCRSQLVRY